MSNGILVTTAQHVPLVLKATSAGRRLLAFLIDLLFIFGYIIALFFIEAKIMDLGILDAFKEERYSFIKLLFMLFMLPAYTYSLWTEYFFRGQTFGKKILGIRVIKIEGYRLNFSDYLIRWIFRMVDIWVWMFLSVYFLALFGDEIGSGLLFMSLFFTGLVAFSCISYSKKSQRLGDYFAGTTVVHAAEFRNIDITILEDLKDDYTPTYPAVIKLSDNDARIIKKTFTRAKEEQNYRLMSKLRARLEEVTGIKNNLSDMEYVTLVMKDFNYLTRKV